VRIRFEVARSRSYYWPWFVKLAKRALHYKVEGKNPECHVVEVATSSAALDLWRVIRSWKGVSIQVNGEPMSTLRFSWIMWKLEQAPQRTAAMLQQIIESKAQERGRGDDEQRWRMGFGPRPDGA
jgi:hypothetical protein